MPPPVESRIGGTLRCAKEGTTEQYCIQTDKKARGELQTLGNLFDGDVFIM